MRQLIDTHCHLDFDRFDEDRDLVVTRAQKAGVIRIVVPAIDLEGGEKVIALTERYDSVYAAVGIHPNSSAGWRDSLLEDLRALAKHPKVVAIGEIGLDYYRDHSPRPVQRQAFSEQLNLATELGLPVIIHNRQAGSDILRLLSESPLSEQKKPGVLHSFSSSWEIASYALEIGFYIGFTGPITYKNADDLRQVASKIPIDRLLIETDAPFLAPQQQRGKRNEPAFVSLVADKLAEIRGIKTDTIASQTTANAIRLFGQVLAQ